MVLYRTRGGAIQKGTANGDLPTLSETTTGTRMVIGQGPWHARQGPSSVVVVFCCHQTQATTKPSTTEFLSKSTQGCSVGCLEKGRLRRRLRRQWQQGGSFGRQQDSLSLWRQQSTHAFFYASLEMRAHLSNFFRSSSPNRLALGTPWSLPLYYIC